MRFQATLLGILSLLILASCSSTKNQSSRKKKEETSFHYVIPEQKVITNWLKFKSELTMDMEGSLITLDAQFRFKQNEVIWVSMTKLGFPLAKMFLTPDSVIFVDSFHKKYLKGTYAELSNKLGSKVSFNLLQNVLLGQIMKDESAIFSWFKQQDLFLSNAPKDSLNTDTLIRSTYKKPFQLQLVDTTQKNLKKYYSAIPEKQEALLVSYLSADTTNAVSIPNKVQVGVYQSNKLSNTLDLVHQKIEWLTELKTPFEIPENYVKME